VAADAAAPPLFDAAVVGGGPAGLSAAAWLGRYRRHALIVDSEEYRNAAVDVAHGYLGHDPIPPSELRERAREEVARYTTVSRRTAKVARISGVRDRFELETEEGDLVLARRVVLCTGVRDVFPEVEGFFEHYGADVFHCASCDGYEARDRDVVVFGWGEHIAGFALGLLTWARSVTVVTDGRRFEGSPEERALLAECGVGLVQDDATHLVGRRGALECVRLAGGASLPCQMAFFSIAHHPNNDLAAALGAVVSDEGCVAADRDGVTSVPGLYAAGDLTPGVQLISNAVAKGAAAGNHCAYSLHGERP
jgi:thioredoxin reductase